MPRWKNVFGAQVKDWKRKKDEQGGERKANDHFCHSKHSLIFYLPFFSPKPSFCLLCLNELRIILAKIKENEEWNWGVLLKVNIRLKTWRNLNHREREREHTFSGFPMIVETALVSSEKMGSVSTPSRLTLVEM